MKGMVATAPEGIAGLRGRALLLVGFAGAFHRSELVALDVADIEDTAEGLRDITVNRQRRWQDSRLMSRIKLRRQN
jgi:site-specific recombinase XerD